MYLVNDKNNVVICLCITGVFKM